MSATGPTRSVATAESLRKNGSSEQFSWSPIIAARVSGYPFSILMPAARSRGSNPTIARRDCPATGAANAHPNWTATSNASAVVKAAMLLSTSRKISRTDRPDGKASASALDRMNRNALGPSWSPLLNAESCTDDSATSGSHPTSAGFDNSGSRRSTSPSFGYKTSAASHANRRGRGCIARALQEKPSERCRTDSAEKDPCQKSARRPLRSGSAGILRYLRLAVSLSLNDSQNFYAGVCGSLIFKHHEFADAPSASHLRCSGLLAHCAELSDRIACDTYQWRCPQ